MQHVCCKVLIYVDSFRGACDVRYSRCGNRARVDVGLSVGINVTVSVPSNKVLVVIVLTKNVVEIITLVSDLVGCQVKRYK